MRPTNNLDIHALVYYVAEQVAARFFHTLRILTNREDDDNSAEIEWFANRITTEIWREWNRVTTSDHAEAKVEEMYNAARTMLVRLLNLQGGTVEFGPGDVQPLTDQRLGQTEAWDRWMERMQEDNSGKDEEQDYSGGWTQEHDDSPCRVEYWDEYPDGTSGWYPIPPPTFTAEQPDRSAALTEYGRFRDMYPGIDSKYVRVISLLD